MSAPVDEVTPLGADALALLIGLGADPDVVGSVVTVADARNAAMALGHTLGTTARLAAK